MSYKDHFKEIEDEIKTLRALNKKQAAMIERRNILVDWIFEDAQEALKGTVLSNIKRKVLIHLKDRAKGK
jgi:uncharacterized protein YecT (DUF1311 family)